MGILTQFKKGTETAILMPEKQKNSRQSVYLCEQEEKSGIRSCNKIFKQTNRKHYLMKKLYQRIAAIAATVALTALSSAGATTYEVNGILYTILNETSAMVYGPASTDIAGAVTLPEKVTIEGKEYTLTGIDGTAFKDCANITSVTLPATIDSIGLQAFNGCSAMKSINLGDTKLRELQVSTFLYCRSLENITIPATVTTVGINPFMENLALKAINVASGNKNFKSVDGVLFTADGKTLISFPPAKTKDYVIPDGTEIIAHSAFCMARNLNTVQFPASVKRLESSAFLRVDSLKSISLPPALVYLGSSAFAECKRATGEIVIPSTVTYLGNKALFYTAITRLEIPGSAGTVPTEMAKYCVKLRNVVLHEGLVQMWDGCFNTTAISEIVIPNSITRIRPSAFVGCTLLKNVTLGSGLKTINTQVFYNLTGLKVINSLAVTPPTVDDYARYPAFTETVYANCRLNVPEAAQDAYKAAATWKKFNTVRPLSVENIGADEVAVNVNGNNIMVLGADGLLIEVYTVAGTKVYAGRDSEITLSEGLYIVKVGNKVFKIAL